MPLDTLASNSVLNSCDGCVKLLNPQADAISHMSRICYQYTLVQVSHMELSEEHPPYRCQDNLKKGKGNRDPATELS